MYGHFTSKCFNLNTKKVKASLHLVDAQELDYLLSFKQSPSTIQSFIVDHPIVSDTSDSYTDSDDSFFVCKIKEQAVTSSPKTRLYADLHTSSSVYSNICI